MKLTLSLLPVSCLAAVITLAATARADTFTFTATGYFNSTGTLTAVPDPIIPSAFDVTAISGTGGINGLLPCATYDPNNPCISSGNGILYDNLLYPGTIPPVGIQVLDYMGIGFSLGNAGLDGDFAAFGSHQYQFLTNVPHDNGHLITFSISPVPEPDSFLLLGAGLLGIAGVVRRRIVR